MRSSKSRSRSKSNRNRPSGNIVNRVFDSSGPEGKVRGTPQQIIDKYTQLARDAQLSGDRVAFENFQQHGEHYTRLLGEAQREMEARREQQERDRERQNQQRREEQAQAQPDQATNESDSGSTTENGLDGDVIAPSGEETTLVETPENTQAKPQRSRGRRRNSKPADQAEVSGDAAGQESPSDSTEAPKSESAEAAE